MTDAAKVAVDALSLHGCRNCKDGDVLPSEATDKHQRQQFDYYCKRHWVVGAIETVLHAALCWTHSTMQNSCRGIIIGI